MKKGSAVRGQALPEFALIAVPLLLLFGGIIQFAWIYNAQVGLTNAVRDSARYGSSMDATTDTQAGTDATRTYAFLTASVAKYVSPYNASDLTTGTQVCFKPYGDNTGVQAVKVKVTARYLHPIVVPLVGAIIDAIDGTSDGKFAIQSSDEMRVDNPVFPTPTLTQDQCTP